MTHLRVSEWGKVAVGDDPGHFSRAQANALIAAASAHPLGGQDGGRILSEHYTYLRAKQLVGAIAAPGCSLEILPKVDPDAPEENTSTVRRRLVQMLDVALGLDIGEGAIAGMARQDETLLDILIRLYADRLLIETRRGLPRAYLPVEEDLPMLRGRLDVTRQFTVHAVRPDRLACRYDNLSHDIALLQAMKACVLFLRKHARAAETQRRLDELRFVLADIADVAPSSLPWDRIRVDRTSRRWETLLRLAKLFLRREWQATHRDLARDAGVTLLFPMNALFEAYVAALLRRTLAGSNIEVRTQGGLLRCLGDWAEGEDCAGHTFQTKPDILLRRGGKVVAVIDTKWKHLARDPFDRRKGVSQSDIYQMMAYARLYDCKRLMLLYPASPGEPRMLPQRFGIHGGREMLAFAKVDVARDRGSVEMELRSLAEELSRPAG